MQSIANGSAKFSVRSSAQIFPLRTDTTLRTGLQLENRDRRSRAPPPPPAARGAARTRWVFCWFFSLIFLTRQTRLGCQWHPYSWRQRNGRPSARPLLPCGWSQL